MIDKILTFFQLVGCNRMGCELERCGPLRFNYVPDCSFAEIHNDLFTANSLRKQ